MNHIRYLAVARVPDKCLIADYAAAETKERPKELFEEKVDKVLLSGGIDSNQRLTIADPNVGNIHYDADPAFLFMGTSIHPRHHALPIFFCL